MLWVDGKAVEGNCIIGDGGIPAGCYSHQDPQTGEVSIAKVCDGDAVQGCNDPAVVCQNPIPF